MSRRERACSTSWAHSSTTAAPRPSTRLRTNGSKKGDSETSCKCAQDEKWCVRAMVGGDAGGRRRRRERACGQHTRLPPLCLLHNCILGLETGEAGILGGS